jgi:hypothetical protein
MNLDLRLRAWAVRRERTPEEINDLAARVVAEAARRRYASSAVPVQPQLLLWSKLSYALGGGIAAMVLWAVGARYYGLSVEHSDDGKIAQLTTPTAAQLGTMRRLFDETARLFPQRLRWITQSNGEMGLGVEAADLEPDRGTVAPMMVRLVAVARQDGEKEWRQVWATDIVMHGQDMAEIALNRDSANKLTLWVYPLDNGRVAVDVGVALAQPIKVASRLNGIVEAGKPTEMVKLRMEETEYRIIQTIMPLDRRGSS